DTEQGRAGGCGDLHERDRARATARAQRSLLVGEYVEAQSERVDDRVDRAIALAVQQRALAVALELQAEVLDRPAVPRVRQLVRTVDVRPLVTEILLLEQCPDLLRAQLLAARVGHGLHGLAELDLQTPGHRQPVIALEQVGDAALAGLAVD